MDLLDIFMENSRKYLARSLLTSVYVYFSSPRGMKMDINILPIAIMYQEKETPALQHVLWLLEIRALTFPTGASTLGFNLSP